MADKKFVVAIGGTGMRCLESFVHLCAIGMFDNEEIEILTLDTDRTNGNKGRVEQLIDTYNHIKSNDATNIDGGSPNADTFFSAKLNIYKFSMGFQRTFQFASRQIILNICINFIIQFVMSARSIYI